MDRWLFSTTGDVVPLGALGLAVALMIGGAGAWSLDALIAR